MWRAADRHSDISVSSVTPAYQITYDTPEYDHLCGAAFSRNGGNGPVAPGILRSAVRPWCVAHPQAVFWLLPVAIEIILVEKAFVDTEAEIC